MHAIVFLIDFIYGLKFKFQGFIFGIIKDWKPGVLNLQEFVELCHFFCTHSKFALRSCVDSYKVGVCIVRSRVYNPVLSVT